MSQTPQFVPCSDAPIYVSTVSAAYLKRALKYTTHAADTSYLGKYTADAEAWQVIYAER